MTNIKEKSQQLSVSERKELRKLVDQQFAIFHRELKQREAEIGEMIREEIVAQHRAKVTKANKMFEAFRTFCNENDLTFDNIYADNRRDLNVRPRNVDGKVKAELRKLRNERGIGEIELEKRKNHVLTEITLGSVRSTAMEEILAAIPDLLLVVPEVTATEVRRQLKAGS